jgi:hypothetical protein
VVATLTGNYYHQLVLRAKLVIAARRLATVTGMKLTEVASTEAFGNTTIMLDWNPVMDAGGYSVNLYYQDGTPAMIAQVNSGTSYNLRRGAWSALLRGNYNLEIVAVPRSGDPSYALSSPSVPINYYHLGRLAAPKIARVENEQLKWDAVPEAQMYEIRAMRFDDQGQLVKSCAFNSDSVNNPGESMSDIKTFLQSAACKMLAGKYRFSIRASTTANGFWVGTYASDSSNLTGEYEMVF